MAVDATYGIGIPINQNEITKIFIMISNWKKTFGLCDSYKNISAL